MEPTPEVLAEHHVLVGSDSPFRSRARLRQALWRERMGFPVGVHRGRPLGSRLAMPFARDTLANYLTPTIRDVVRAEVIAATRRSEKLYQEPRIFEDLLSSQPLCFNLFGELARDLALASRTFAILMGMTELEVTNVHFEHSPGRGDLRFTGDYSAFDVFVAYATPVGRRGFIGIEVKYVEDLNVAPARHRPRYDEVARAMAAFREDAMSRLRAAPLEQFWRDHLLAGSLLLHDGALTHATFAVVYPSENEAVGAGVRAYGECLTDPTSFTSWTLEEVLTAMNRGGAGEWLASFHGRYLGDG